MKYTYLLLALTLLAWDFGMAQPEGSDKGDGVGGFSQLEWLTGSWQRTDTRPGVTAFERWSADADGLSGMGYMLEGADTLFIEKLSIRKFGESLYYIAEVDHNVEPTRFRITRISDTGFVSENPAHDFPKKIEYRLEKSGVLKATISGGGRVVTFVFRKESDR
ncbi:MAG: DUF6265 family protein [Balneolaceae bacterium]|nr:DUF6265 family protein [Balneolaceae bacterium]